MPAPPEADAAKTRKYCRARVPARLRHQVRVEAAIRGNSVTSSTAHHWSLYWVDRNGRWRRYDDLDPGPVDKALNEIEADPTCISAVR